ncbi:unnamed protein product [Alternaria burnsii]|nr:unnamed protein product [Alternaria burnsii]
MDDKVAESLGRLELATQSHHHISTDEQDDSHTPPFFRLPAELRLMIYQHVFANEIIHVQPKSTDPLGDTLEEKRRPVSTIWLYLT